MIVELAPPPAIEPPKAPEPPKEMAPESSAKNVAPAPRLAAHAPPVQSPAAARAGALLTAKEDISKPSDAPPVDFVTDPSGTTYGGGVVARGGTADFGVRGATAAGVGHTPVSPSAAPSDGVTAPANLSRAPRLTEPDACRGYYPSEANVDEGGATVAVIVKANGDVSQATVLSETPVGQGFGHAARTCLSQKRFAPAQDRQGAAVIARTSVRVRFSR
jgi:outer membrane biosynthesis protein TonB